MREGMDKSAVTPSHLEGNSYVSRHGSPPSALIFSPQAVLISPPAAHLLCRRSSSLSLPHNSALLEASSGIEGDAGEDFRRCVKIKPVWERRWQMILRVRVKEGANSWRTSRRTYTAPFRPFPSFDGGEPASLEDLQRFCAYCETWEDERGGLPMWGQCAIAAVAPYFALTPVVAR